MTRTRVVILGVVGVMVVGGATVGGWALWQTHTRRVAAFEANGQKCTHTANCEWGACIHDGQDDRYCGSPCDDDRDCPSAYVCESTYSEGRACMKAGAYPARGAQRRAR